VEFETRAIHAGQEPDPLTGSVNVPIYQTSTYAQDGVLQMRGGHDYARTINPTRTALEQCLASLEAARTGLLLSGMGATTAIMELFAPGSRTSPSTMCTAAPTGCSPSCTSRRGTPTNSPT
jgi:cystathionine gamma-synthase